MALTPQRQPFSRNICLLIHNRFLSYQLISSLSSSVLASPKTNKKSDLTLRSYSNSSSTRPNISFALEKNNVIGKNSIVKSNLPNKWFFRNYPRGVRVFRETEPSTQQTISFENIGENLRTLELEDPSQKDLESARIHKYKPLKKETTVSTSDYKRSKTDNHEKEVHISPLSDISPAHEGLFKSKNLTRYDMSILEQQQLPQIKSSKDIDHLSLPELSKVAQTLVPFVNRFPTLQKLVHLGVDLSIVQAYEGIGAHLLRCTDFDKELAPLVRFLVDVCVPLDKVGQVLTNNPYLFTEDSRELEKRVGYLIHMKFTLPEVGSMVTECPMLLLMTPQHLDKKLGTLQQSFSLTGDEVRLVAVKHPQILPFKRRIIALNKFVAKEMVGFSNEEMKAIILKCPQVFVTHRNEIVRNMDYLHNTMLIPHEQLVDHPAALIGDNRQLQQRHQFLVSRRRAQYDPCEPMYVSLKALTDSDDSTFCNLTAKCQVNDFYDFLKTI